MDKSEAIKLFNTVAELAGALGISRQAVYKWPDKLPQDQVDRIVGAGIRTGRIDPGSLRSPVDAEPSEQEAA